MEQQYELTYSGDGQAAQANMPAAAAPMGQPVYVQPARRSWLAGLLGGTFGTAFGLVMATTAFFAVEHNAPAEWKPSTLVGSYDARLTAAVKAAELQQQTRYDGWLKQVELVNAQNQEQYRSALAGLLGNYQAGYERARVFATATAEIQQQYVATRMSQARAMQNSDEGVVNLSRLLGRLGNLVSPGMGDPALDYADNLTGQLQSELDAAAANGQTLRVDGWDTHLPAPATVAAQVAAIHPQPLPVPPRLSDDRPYVGGGNGQR